MILFIYNIGSLILFHFCEKTYAKSVCQVALHKQDIPDSSVVKNPPAMKEAPVGFLGWEHLLEKG